jgi:glycosyltransferase involved in cell wall biosynthesis
MTKRTHEPRSKEEAATAVEAPQRPAPEKQGADAATLPRQIIGRFVEPGPTNGAAPPVAPPANGSEPRNAGPGGRDAGTAGRTPMVVFCHEPPDSYIGGHVAGIIPALARRGSAVHLFSRHPYPISDSKVTVHVVGASEEGDVLEQVKEYTRRAGNAFMQQFPPNQPVAVLGYEWTSAGVLSLLRGLRNLQGVLSLHTLERQRSDLSSDVARQIAEIEREGVEKARVLLLHDPATGEVLRQWMPESADRTVQCRSLFNVKHFETGVDPGAVKARYEVGPVDPVILFVGDLDERYGPDLLLKAMPAVLRHHPQVRLVIVGDGQLFWPLRVYARYLLLEHAVRLVGHVTDQPMYELVQAADLIAVPSREPTPWWPVLAGWAARKPVVATHTAAKALLEHEKDSVLVYPSENSIVWGVERVLYDADLARCAGQAGRQKLETRFGWNALAEQVEEVLLAAPATSLR